MQLSVLIEFGKARKITYDKNKVECEQNPLNTRITTTFNHDDVKMIKR